MHDPKKRPPPLVPFHPSWNGVSIPKEHWHFHIRLWERYGIVLRPGEYSRIFEKAVVKKAKPIVVTHRGRVHPVFLYGPQEMIFVIANDRQLITVLTPTQAFKRRDRYRARLAKEAAASL